MREKNGRFLAGQSGNPGGRPKDEYKVAELARSYTVEAVETLVDLMRHSRDDRVRGTASQALLDRGWGKAKVEVATSGGETYLLGVSVLIPTSPHLSHTRHTEIDETCTFMGIYTHVETWCDRQKT